MALAAGALLAPVSALAANIDVTTVSDEYSDPGAGAGCSLRETVEAAGGDLVFGGCNAGGGVSLDTIRFVAGANYALTRPGAGEDANSSGDLDLDTTGGPVAIQPLGVGGRPTLDAGFIERSLDQTAAPREPAAEPTVIGHSVQGRPIRAVQVGDPEAERVVLVVGVIHGDERAGLRIARELRRLGPGIDDAQVWVIDSLNPDGAHARERSNAHSVDLNRNFPHRWRAGVPRSSGYYPGPSAGSEPETKAAMDFIERIDPDLSIWYHQPWGAVLACEGRPSIAARYAKLSGMSTSCRGKGLPGTAIGWENASMPGSASFVVELRAGAIGERAARRQARAAATVAERD